MAGGIAQYSPYIFFDSRELYFPSSIEYYISNVLQTSDDLDDYIFGFNTQKDLSRVPLYVTIDTVKEQHTVEYTYVMVFPYRFKTYICGCIPWSKTPQTHKFCIRVDLKTNFITHLTVDGIVYEANNLELFDDTHPVLYYFEGNFSSSPQTECCYCYGHDQCGYVFKPTLFHPLSFE